MPSDAPRDNAPRLTLPAKANLEWLKNQAKALLKKHREKVPSSKLADAQLTLARVF